MIKPDSTSKRILIVEDEPAIRRVLSEILSPAGFEVDFAANGQEAIPKLNQESYDLFIIDLRTPVMNGQELYQYITGKHPELSSKVIFTSGDLMNQDTSAFLGESGRPLLAKPFTPDEVITIVNNTLRLEQD